MNKSAIQYYINSIMALQQFGNTALQHYGSVIKDGVIHYAAVLPNCRNSRVITPPCIAPTHALYETTYLTNITIKYLPPNTTSHLQPCDQSIINSFKSQYRKLYLRNRVKAFDKFREFSIEPVKININKCIKYVAHA